MIIFGLTGGIASGKSTITKTFREYDIPIVDADVVARQVVTPSSNGLNEIISIFGTDYLNANGDLNREKLGNLVFKNQSAMLKLSKIMGPLIDEEAARQIKVLSNKYSIIGYDAALIIENNNAEKYKPLIVVSCSKQTQVERLMKRNSLTEEQALDRINAQLPIEVKVKYADYIIDTSGRVEDTRVQTFSIIQDLLNKVRKMDESSNNSTSN